MWKFCAWKRWESMPTNPILCRLCLCNEESSGCWIGIQESTTGEDPENVGGLTVLPRRCAEEGELFGRVVVSTQGPALLAA